MMRSLPSQARRAWRGCVSAAALAFAASVSSASPPATEELTLALEYKVFIRGVRVGSAFVRTETGDGRYRVCGRMQTTDIWARMAPWEARFDVRGRIEEARAVPETFWMHERARKKRDRVIRVAGGVLRQERDGEKQGEEPAPGGVDLMSFFWVTASCDADPVLNNGRKSYTMKLRGRAVADDGEERCDYAIVDDDGEKSPARFEFVDREGRRVPKTVTMPATLRRQLRLDGASRIEGVAPGDACPSPDFAGQES